MWLKPAGRLASPERGSIAGGSATWPMARMACSLAVAQVSLDFSAAAAARFLTERVLPAYQAAAWPVRRVLTDQGNEYRGAFDQACIQRRIRHTRTKPRHAWTNGFVERLQGTILSELWRVEFRRWFFTHTVAMQTALDRYVEFYDHRRPHQRYRTRGRTPGEIFFSRRARSDKRPRHQSVNTHPV